MNIRDKDLAEITDTNTTIEIENKNYYVKSNRSGSCDGCAFIGGKTCPSKAVTICTSNGGNILVEKEPYYK